MISKSQRRRNHHNLTLDYATTRLLMIAQLVYTCY